MMADSLLINLMLIYMITPLMALSQIFLKSHKEMRIILKANWQFYCHYIDKLTALWFGSLPVVKLFKLISRELILNTQSTIYPI